VKKLDKATALALAVAMVADLVPDLVLAPVSVAVLVVTQVMVLEHLSAMALAVRYMATHLALGFVKVPATETVLVAGAAALAPVSAAGTIKRNS
jgi:hypothetical protein